MKNLNTFNEMFKGNKEIKFPFPFEENTKDSVLIETFVEGVPVTYYESNRHPLNKVIARLGSATFFEMLMKNNFIHADCHGGNIFIEIREQSYNFMTEIRDSMKELYYSLETKLKSMNFSTEKMKRLYLESRQEEQDIRNLLRQYKERIVVNVIDAGMVITLNEKDKKNFVNFIKSVIEGRG
jgi:aarF domain-containing kinase